MNHGDKEAWDKEENNWESNKNEANQVTNPLYYKPKRETGHANNCEHIPKRGTSHAKNCERVPKRGASHADNCERIPERANDHATNCFEAKTRLLNVGWSTQMGGAFIVREIFT